LIAVRLKLPELLLLEAGADAVPHAATAPPIAKAAIRTKTRGLTKRLIRISPLVANGHRREQCGQTMPASAS
jgi:hypothetical protein